MLAMQVYQPGHMIRHVSILATRSCGYHTKSEAIHNHGILELLHGHFINEMTHVLTVTIPTSVCFFIVTTFFGLVSRIHGAHPQDCGTSALPLFSVSPDCTMVAISSSDNTPSWSFFARQRKCRTASEAVCIWPLLDGQNLIFGWSTLKVASCFISFWS